MSNKPLIEVYDNSFCDLQIVEAKSDIQKGTVVRARGRFQMAETKNQNGRVYAKSLLEREISKLQSQIESRSLFGELDHPQVVSTSLQNASHVITELSWNGNEIIGEYEVLNTRKGQDLKAILTAGCKPGISSRGSGSLVREGSELKVAPDFRLISFDAVADPSTFGAHPVVQEGQIITLEEALLMESNTAVREQFIIELQNDSYLQSALAEAFYKAGLKIGHLQEAAKGDIYEAGALLQQLSGKKWLRIVELQETKLRVALKELFCKVNADGLLSIYEGISTDTDEMMLYHQRRMAGLI